MVRAFNRSEVTGKFDTTAEMNNLADVSSSADLVSSTVVSDGDLEVHLLCRNIYRYMTNRKTVPHQT